MRGLMIWKSEDKNFNCVKQPPNIVCSKITCQWGHRKCGESVSVGEWRVDVSIVIYSEVSLSLKAQIYI